MNEYIAAAVDELYELGVRDAVISPGSRSTPLAVLLCEHKFHTYLNIDERSAGFFALGIAKEQVRPVVLVCTSGSAAAHYMPAITEAKQSRVPLIVLTADRPPGLRNVYAPQTINQNEIFGRFIKYFEELAIPAATDDSLYPRMVMRKAFLHCRGVPQGPVQINIPLREPLIPKLNHENFRAGRSKVPFRFAAGNMQVDFDDTVLAGKKGIIICGARTSLTGDDEILYLAKQLKVPILADPLSNLRNYDSANIIDSYDAFLKASVTRAELKPDFILLFGQPPVSKRLQQFISDHNTAACYQIDEAAEYRNPSLTTTQYIQAGVTQFASQVQVVNENQEYLRQWQGYHLKMREKINMAAEESCLFEGKIVRLIQEIMPENSRLSVANSMAVRDIDYFWTTKQQQIKILCNRGTNGIDGTISTALGISTCGYPTVLLTGDLALFHDLTGFLIGKTHDLNLVVVLLNNNGGGIFQYLPQNGMKHYDYLFTTPHGIDFKGIQTLYGLRYERAGNYAEFQQHFETAVSGRGICLIEVIINMDKSRELHEKYTTP